MFDGEISLIFGCLIDFDFDLIASNTIKVDFYGTLFMKTGIEFGIGNIAKIEAGIKGNSLVFISQLHLKNIGMDIILRTMLI